MVIQAPPQNPPRSKKKPVVPPKCTNIFIGEIGALKSKPRSEYALQMIYEIANLVGPVMREYGFKVGKLVEFYPADKALQGLNLNRGEKISLRLRTPYNVDRFLSKYQVLGTMLHELTHNLFGPHDRIFHNKLEELIVKQQQFMDKGTFQLVFEGFGDKLGGVSLGPKHCKEARLKKLDRKFHGGMNRLGGGSTDNTTPPASDQDIKDLIRAAALNRASGDTSSSEVCTGHGKKIEELSEDEDDLEILDVRQINGLEPFKVKEEHNTETLRVTPPAKRIVMTVYEQTDQRKTDNIDKLEALIKARKDQPIIDHVPVKKKRKARKTESEKVKEAVREQWKEKELADNRKKRKMQEDEEILEISSDGDDHSFEESFHGKQEKREFSFNDEDKEIIDLTSD